MTTERYMVIRVLSEVGLYNTRHGMSAIDNSLLLDCVSKHFGLTSEDRADITRAIMEAEAFNWPCTSNI